MLKHKIKREVFLDKMESVIHWDKWCAIIEPFYYKGEHGRPPRGIECRGGMRKWKICS